jgi:hypothetical protein
VETESENKESENRERRSENTESVTKRGTELIRQRGGRV